MTRAANVERYYRLHAPIYDLTRWTFLFRRQQAARWVGLHGRPRRILEVGCGTGNNLVRLARMYPQAEITGVDLSPDMLAQAQRQTARFGDRVRLHEGAYGEDDTFADWPDVILFAYSLTMMGSAVGPVLDRAAADLGPSGTLVAVDFDDTPLPLFTAWMARNHVDVDGSVRPRVHERFRPVSEECGSAYGGLWSFFVFAGTPRV